MSKSDNKKFANIIFEAAYEGPSNVICIDPVHEDSTVVVVLDVDYDFAEIVKEVKRHQENTHD